MKEGSSARKDEDRGSYHEGGGFIGKLRKKEVDKERGEERERKAVDEELAKVEWEGS